MDNPYNLEALAQQEAKHLMRRWYLHPEFSHFDLYHGIHLGECAEYIFFLSLARVIKSKLINDPSVITKIGKKSKPEKVYLRWERIYNPVSLQLNATDTINKGSKPLKPTVLISVRVQNLAIVNAIWAIRSFNLVIDGKRDAIEGQLKQALIQYETFDSFLAPDVKSTVEREFQRLYPKWMKSLESESFQSQFSLGGVNFFEDIKDSLKSIFQKQFFEEIVSIETLKTLARMRRLAMVVLWDDTLPHHKALIFCAQGMGIPVLHLAHSVHGSGEFVCADKVAVYGDFGRQLYISNGNQSDKIVVTGNPDWDKYKYLPQLMQRKSVCRAFDLDFRKKTVLFATFWIAGPILKGDPSQVGKFYRALLQAIRQLQKRHPIQLVVKLHPAERDRKSWYKKIAVEEDVEDVVIQSNHLEELLFISDVVICRGSNIGFEALILGKPVISYEVPLFGEEKAVIVVREINDLTNVIEKTLFNSSTRKELKKERDKTLYKYNYLDDGMATYRVMKTIESMTGIKIELPEDFIPYISSSSGYQGDELMSGERSLKSFIERGEYADAKGEFEKALSIYHETLKKYPAELAVKVKLGKTLLKMGRLDEAVECLTGILKMKPVCIESLLQLSLALYLQKKYISALEYLKRVVDAHSSHEGERELAWYYIGRCNKQMNDLEEAEKSFQQSILLNPDSKAALKELGNLYFNTGRFDMASTFFQRIIERDSRDTEALNDLGVVFFHAGKMEEAKLYLKKAIKIKPDYIDALSNLIEVEKKQKP